MMTEQVSRSAQVTVIDQFVREIAWNGQKQAAHMLNDPDIDLTLPQMMTLSAIANCGTCRMSTLAGTTHQSAGTLTGIVDRLIEDGLVERTRNEGDRRVVEVMLTQDGQRRLSSALMACQEHTRGRLAHFNDDDLSMFTHLLQRYLYSIQNGNGNGTVTSDDLVQAVEA
ncbi:MAG: DNA-binding transcriptional regulator, MarR family [Chloroflexi bacterium AL-N1]|nr:DNA-binding transcriptional regulator, MarR family [Chloroflexi bacterium AL-N1]NOK72464.1 DNA-binding transcriptional regulator, MarR family [Chloroflexi bacterium AL-N5]NOK87366.1 DNA-binding transcriptional regulator, MarR family [Chloroflexi bacterium AL-N15]